MIYTKQQIIESHPRFCKLLNSPDEICTYDGWNSILFAAASSIEEAIEYRMDLPEEEKSKLYAVQIKSKFGGLRIYTNFTYPYINGIILMAGKMSIHTCEICGNEAQIREINRWYWTLCTHHYEIKTMEINKR